MDTDNFFGFDASLAPDDGCLEGGPEDEEYDALNDETFGSAMVDGDWEEGHEQMATLTEAGRISNKQKQLQNALRRDDDGGLAADFHNLGLGRFGSQDGNRFGGSEGGRLGQGSAPINIVGYQSGSSAHHHHMSSALLAGPDLPGSPSNSIWTPSPVLDKLLPVSHHSPSNGVNHSLNQMHVLNQGGMSQPLGLPSIKTVAELEEELKMQQQSRDQTPHGLHMNVVRAEDLERELARQTANKQPQQQHHHPGMNNQMPNHHQYLPRQGSFSGGMPNNHSQMNRQFQRPFGSPGNFQNQMPHIPHQHHQQQRYINNFHNNNNKGMFGQHQMQQQHHHHNQPHAHPNQGHEGFNNYHHHHQNSYNNHYSQQQQQQQNYHHYNNRNPDNRYFNHNGLDSSRGGNERRNMDRRNYDQNRGYDQGKGRQNNSRDDYSGHSGGRTRRDSEAEWEEWHRLREQDEYCGLMTPREKSWLKNIQAMQLHSDSPYQDDYYYVMYSVKQQRKREEEVIEIDGLQLLLPDRGKDGGREYEPPRLENSLGKLQVVSVNAPRKIIDLQVVHLDPSHPTTPLQREMRKHRHLLLHIEKLFNVMMELDDLERKIRLLPDCPTRDLFQSKSRTLASKLWENIHATPERLVQLLCIRKGKSLLVRLLNWLGPNECEKVVMTILQNMTLLSKRDTHDHHLELFWPITDHLIDLAVHQQLLEFASALIAQGGGPQKANLVSALYNKYGVSLLMALMVRGESLLANLEDSPEWQEFLLAIITGLVAVPDNTGKPSNDSSKTPSEMPQALPSVAVAASPHRPAQHLARCKVADPAVLKVAQEKMTALTVSHTKPKGQSPAKS